MRKATTGVSLIGALVLSASAAGAAATVLHAPGAARVGETVTVSATGLRAGGYALTLVSDSHPANGVSCVARLSATRPSSGGAITLSGRIPRSLTCFQGATIRLGTVRTAKGAYHLVVASPTAPAGFDARRSFVRAALRVTG